MNLIIVGMRAHFWRRSTMPTVHSQPSRAWAIAASPAFCMHAAP